VESHPVHLRQRNPPIVSQYAEVSLRLKMPNAGKAAEISRDLPAMHASLLHRMLTGLAFAIKALHRFSGISIF
jgi:hypothetical protein